jgi:hypothetical protein
VFSPISSGFFIVFLRAQFKPYYAILGYFQPKMANGWQISTPYKTGLSGKSVITG